MTTIRAAIDIGMGGPKLQIAEVDTVTNKIVKTIHTQLNAIEQKSIYIDFFRISL